ncbi:MAG: hypothetical protein AB7O97_18660 [Planctomycetota bacterium]
MALRAHAGVLLALSLLGAVCLLSRGPSGPTVGEDGAADPADGTLARRAATSAADPAPAESPPSGRDVAPGLDLALAEVAHDVRWISGSLHPVGGTLRSPFVRMVLRDADGEHVERVEVRHDSTFRQAVPPSAAPFVQLQIYSADMVVATMSAPVQEGLEIPVDLQAALAADAVCLRMPHAHPRSSWYATLVAYEEGDTATMVAMSTPGVGVEDRVTFHWSSGSSRHIGRPMTLVVRQTEVRDDPEGDPADDAARGQRGRRVLAHRAVDSVAALAGTVLDLRARRVRLHAGAEALGAVVNINSTDSYLARYKPFRVGDDATLLAWLPPGRYYAVSEVDRAPPTDPPATGASRPLAFSFFEVPPGEGDCDVVLELDRTLPGPGAVAVTVVDEVDAPVRDAQVAFVSLETEMSEAHRGQAPATDAQGHTRIDGLWTSRYVLRVKTADDRVGYAFADVGRDQTVTVQIAQHAYLNARLSGLEQFGDAVISSAETRIWYRLEGSGAWTAVASKTREQDGLRVAYLPRGAVCDVAVRGRLWCGVARWHRVDETPKDVVDIAVSPLTEVRGDVLDDRRDGVRVVARGEDADLPWGNVPVDGAGAFEVAFGDPATRALLVVDAKGRVLGRGELRTWDGGRLCIRADR